MSPGNEYKVTQAWKHYSPLKLLPDLTFSSLNFGSFLFIYKAGVDWALFALFCDFFCFIGSHAFLFPSNVTSKELTRFHLIRSGLCDDE